MASGVATAPTASQGTADITQRGDEGPDDDHPNDDQGDGAASDLRAWTIGQLDHAVAELPDGGQPAARLAARALRGYVASRFGVETAPRTTEELRETTPPFAARSRSRPIARIK